MFSCSLVTVLLTNRCSETSLISLNYYFRWSAGSNPNRTQSKAKQLQHEMPHCRKTHAHTLHFQEAAQEEQQCRETWSKVHGDGAACSISKAQQPWFQFHWDLNGWKVKQRRGAFRGRNQIQNPLIKLNTNKTTSKTSNKPNQNSYLFYFHTYKKCSSIRLRAPFLRDIGAAAPCPHQERTWIWGWNLHFHHVGVRVTTPTARARPQSP